MTTPRKFGSITARKVYGWTSGEGGHVRPAGYRLKLGGKGGFGVEQRHSRKKWSIKWVKRLLVKRLPE